MRPCASLADAVLFTTSPLLMNDADREAFQKVEAAVRLSRYGGDCYAYCMLAAGHVDLVIETGLKPYDIIPLVPIIAGAGGIVTTWENGSPVDRRPHRRRQRQARARRGAGDAEVVGRRFVESRLFRQSLADVPPCPRLQKWKLFARSVLLRRESPWQGSRRRFRDGNGMTDRFTTAQSTEAIRRWCPPAIALATVAALSALTASPADAQARKAAPRPAQATEATAPRQAGEAIMAIVSIKSQKVTIYDADGWILSAPVSTGTKGRETPAGVFAVVEKNKDHRSNMYDDAWMPHMLRITWNGIALHGGPLPGYAASHGCVRMPFGFAEKLFDKDAHEHAYHHLAERRGAGGVFPSGSVRAESGGPRGCAGARRKARPRGGRGRQDVQTGEEEGRSEGRDGVAAQAGTGDHPGPG